MIKKEDVNQRVNSLCQMYSNSNSDSNSNTDIKIFGHKMDELMMEEFSLDDIRKIKKRYRDKLINRTNCFIFNGIN